MNITEEYIKINNSFKRTVVYRIGDEAGFFSEYNNMVLAIIYCLENKYRFVLSSKNSNFSIQDGWNDFFLPFCDEKNTSFHLKYNHRPDNQQYFPIWKKVLHKIKLTKSASISFPFYIRLLRIMKLTDILTQDIFDKARSLKMSKNYVYPSLQINGDLLHACSKIAELTWRFNQETKENVERLISSIELPENYIGIHIRAGDKYKEYPLIKSEIYLKKIENITSLRKIFISTDDYSIIENFKNNFTEWELFTSCKPEDKGYFHEEFMKNNKVIIKEEYLKLFYSIELLLKSQVFVGTYSSNIGMFLGMKLPPSRVIGIDFDDWRIL